MSLVVQTARPRGRRRWPRVSLATAAATLVAALSLVPIGFIAYVAVDAGWVQTVALVVRPKVGELLVNTVLLEVLTLPLAAVLSLALAFLVERTDVRFASLWSWLMVAPLAVPAFVQSYAWNTVAPLLHGLPGAVLVSILAYFPFLYLPLAAQLRRLDPVLEETAASLGVSPAAAFFRVILPQLRVALLGGSLLVGLHLLAEYGLFVLMRYDTFATAIVDQFQSVYTGPAANLLGGVLVLLCGGLLGLDWALRGHARYARVGAGAPRRPRRVRLGRMAWAGVALPLAVAVLALGVPLYTLVRWLVIGGAGVWRVEFVFGAVGQTALLAVLGAALCLAAAFPVAWLSVRAPGRLQRVLEACHYYVGALPGLIVALALVSITVRVALPLYQTLATLLIGYMLMFLPRAVVGLRASIAQAPVELERAAMSLGQPPFLAVWRTTVRLAAPGAAASMAIVALGIGNELTGTLMLAPNGVRTLATRFWAYSAELDFAAAAPYALMLVLLSLPLVVLLRLEADRQLRR